MDVRAWKVLKGIIKERSSDKLSRDLVGDPSAYRRDDKRASF